MDKKFHREIGSNFYLAVAHMQKRISKYLAVLLLFGILMSLLPQLPHTFANAVAPQPINEPAFNRELEPTTSDSDFDSSQVNIAQEVVGERTATSKTFRKVDGTYEIAVYGDVVHYYQNGTYHDIDNRLSYDPIENAYRTNQNSFQVQFPSRMDDHTMLSITSDQYSLEWKVLSTKQSGIGVNAPSRATENPKELPFVIQSVQYQDIQPNVDIEYVVTGSRVKENILLQAYIPDFEISFEYVANNLRVVYDENGAIQFLDRDGLLVFRIDELLMTDAQMNESTDLQLKFEPLGDDRYHFTLIPSDEWLKSAVYPIIIDPTVVINQTTTNGIRDKYVDSKSNYSTSNFLKVGKNGTELYRSYIEISTATIPSDAVVTYAHLQLKTYYSSAYNYCDMLPCQVNLKAVNNTSTWTSITRNNFMDVNSFIEDYEFVLPTDGFEYYRWDITKVLNRWIDNQQTLGSSN